VFDGAITCLDVSVVTVIMVGIGVTGSSRVGRSSCEGDAACFDAGQGQWWWYSALANGGVVVLLVRHAVICRV